MADSSQTGSSQETWDSSAVLEELLADLRASLERYYGESDPSAYAARYADRMTTFDVWSKGKLEDAAAKDHLLGFAGAIPNVSYRILNPRVDVLGDTAVFTFNVELTEPGAVEIFAVWNTTEVVHHVDDGWELVHTHWSFAVPPAELPEL